MNSRWEPAGTKRLSDKGSQDNCLWPVTSLGLQKVPQYSACGYRPSGIWCMFGDQEPVSPLRGPKDSLVLGATVVATTSLSSTRVLVLGPATAPLQGKNSDVLWDVAEVVPEDESGRSRPSGLSEPPEELCFWTRVGKERFCQDLPLPFPRSTSQHPGTFCKQDNHLQSSRACVYVALPRFVFSFPCFN